MENTKYICIDLFGLSRLGCPCLRLTDDDDDSRPAQMIPIALMIPARVWSTFYNISISSWWWWSRTKTSLASRPGISALIISLCVPIFLLFIVLMKCKSDSCFYSAGQGGLATKTQSCLLVLVMVLVLTATLFICLLAHSTHRPELYHCTMGDIGVITDKSKNSIEKIYRRINLSLGIIQHQNIDH